MSTPRFAIGRAYNGSVLIKDSQRGNRAAIIILRDLDGLPQDKADAAAVRMAEICMEALNRAHEARAKKETA